MEVFKARVLRILYRLFYSLVLPVLIGSITALVVSAFVIGSYNFSIWSYTVLRKNYHWIFLLYPFVTVFVVWMKRWILGIDRAFSSFDTAIYAYHINKKLGIDNLVDAFAVFIVSGVGIAAGKTGPAMFLACIVAALMGSYMIKDYRYLYTMAVASSFAWMFKTPIAAALIAVEIFFKKGIAEEYVMPAFAAAFTGYFVRAKLDFQTYTFLGVIDSDKISFNSVYAIHLISFGILIAVVGSVFIRLFSYFLRLREKLVYKEGLYVAVLIGVGVLAAFGVGLTDAAFSSSEFFLRKLQMFLSGKITLGLREALVAFGVELLIISMVAGIGVPAGIVAPTLVIGGLLGVSYALLFDLKPDMFFVVGIAGMFSFVFQAPISMLIFSLELTGRIELAPYVILSFVFTMMFARDNLVFGNSILKNQRPKA